MRMTRRRWIGAGVGAVVLGAAVAGWNTLPGAGLRWAVVDGLRRLGMAEVSLSDADISLFGGKVVVHSIVANAPGGRPLGLRDLTLGFHWRPLLDRKVVVDALALEGLDIEVTRTAKGIEVNGLPLAVTGGGGAGGDAWTYDLGSLRLSNSRLILADGATRLVVELDRLDLDDLSSGSPEVPLKFHLAGRANGAPLTLTGTATPFAADPGFAARLDVDRFDLAALAALQAKGHLAAHLGLSGRATEWEAAGTLAVEAPAVAGATAKTLAVELGRLHHRGDVLTLKGAADLGGLAAAAGPATVAAATLHLDAAELAWAAGSHRLSWSGGAAAQGLKVTADGIDAAPERLAWSGRAELDPATLAGRAEGRVETDRLQAVFGALTLGLRRLAVDGRAEFGQGGVAATATLGLAADGLLLREPGLGQDWLSAEHIDATDLQLSTTGGVAIGRLAAKTVAGLRRDRVGPARGFPWRAEARTLAAERLRLDTDGAAGAASAVFDGLTLRLTRTDDGFLGLAAGPAAPQQPPAAQPAPLPPLALGRLSVTGASKVVFEDRTTPERVRIELQAVELSLADLDSAKPERDSPFSLNAEIGEATIAAHGHARPFAAELSGEVLGEIRGLELPPLSPYAADALGVTLHTGHFDGKLQVAARRRALEGKVDLVLSDLFVDQPDPNAPLRRKVDMPIETVLDLLRDGEDRIRLAIPIGGDLANPDFDVSDAVSQAVAGALKSTAVTTLKVMFPVAAIIGMVIDADDHPHLSLQPVVFDPGAEALPDGAPARLDGVAELLKARPNLKLKLCGKAGPADWPALFERRRLERQPLLAKLQKLVGLDAKELPPPNHDALAELAAHRAGLAKEYLADRAGIDAARLFECRPEVEPEGKPGRVDLLL